MVPTNHLTRQEEKTQQGSGRVFPPSFQKPTQQQHTLCSSWNPPDPPHPSAGVMAALTDAHPSSGSGASLPAQPLEAVAVDSSFLSAAGRASCGDASVPACCRGKGGECGKCEEEGEEEEGEGVSCREAQPSVCSVCGNKADGNFFGATVCLPCKSFFIRCTKDGEPSILQQCQGNCDVTKQLRNRCQFCRFQRCLDVGMTRKEKPEVVLAEEGQALCRVCGDLANGVHFGVITCEGCKKFFRRGLKEHESYVCRSSRDCVLNPRNRNNCRYCRYHKCLAAGMSRDAIKMGRPRKLLSKADQEDVDLIPAMISAEAPSVDTPSADPDPQTAPHPRPLPPPPPPPPGNQRPAHPQHPPVSLVQNLTPPSSSTGGSTDWISPSGSLWNTVSAGTTTPSPVSISSSVSLATANLPSSGSQTSSMFSAAAAQGVHAGSLQGSIGDTQSPGMSYANSSAALPFPVTSFAVDPSAVISEHSPQAGFAGLASSGHVSLAPSQTGQGSWLSSSSSSSSTALSMSHSRLLRTAGGAEDACHTSPSTAGSMADVFPKEQSSQMEDFSVPLTFQSYQSPLPSSQAEFSDLFASDAAGFASFSKAAVPTNTAPVAASQASASLPFPCPPALELTSPLLSSAAACTGTCGRKDCPFYARTSNTNNLYQHFSSQSLNSAAQPPPLQRFVKSLQQSENRSGFSHSSSCVMDVSLPEVQAGGAAQRPPQLGHQDSSEDLTRAVKIPRRDDNVEFGRLFGLPEPCGQEQQVSDAAQTAGIGTLTEPRPAPFSSQAEEARQQASDVWSQAVHPATHPHTAPRAEGRPRTSEEDASLVQDTDTQPKAAESGSPSASNPQWTQQQQQQQQGQPPKTGGGKDWRLKGVYDPYLNKDEMFRVNQMFVSLNTLMEVAEGERSNPWGAPGSGQTGPSEVTMLEDLMQTQYRFSPRSTIRYWHTLAARCQQVPVGGGMPGRCQHILDTMLQAYTELIDASDNSKYESVETGGSIWHKDDRVKTYWNAIQRRIVRGTQCCIKCAHQVPGMERLHPNDKNLLIRRDVVFSMGLLSASTVFFDADKKDFKHFFNWKLEPDHPMAMFRQRLVALGRKIFDLQMDLNEVALIFALNSVCLDNGEFTDADTMDSVMLDLLMTLNCYISCLRKMSPKHRMQSLFKLMPRMRMMGVWHGCLLKNMKFDTNLMKIDIDNIQLDDRD